MASSCLFATAGSRGKYKHGGTKLAPRMLEMCQTETHGGMERVMQREEYHRTVGGHGTGGGGGVRGGWGGGSPVAWNYVQDSLR
jgi:hypothetical protein